MSILAATGTKPVGVDGHAWSGWALRRNRNERTEQQHTKEERNSRASHLHGVNVGRLPFKTLGELPRQRSKT